MNFNINIKKAIIIVAAILVMAIFAGCGVIPSGETGVLVVDGIVQDEVMSEGRYGALGARTYVVNVNNKRQNYTYSSKIYGESEDQTVVYAEGVIITYQISKDASVWMVRNMGKDFQECILPDSKIASAVKNALANIATENCTNRSYIEPATKQEIQSALDGYYYPGAVEVIDVSISQMDYEDSYNAQIAQISALKKQAEADAITNQMKIDAAKAEAEAETTKAEAAKKTAEANAEIALINARNEAEVAKINAESYAEAHRIEEAVNAEYMKMICDLITPEYIEYMKYEKWNGALPTHTNGETYFSVSD